MHIWLRGVLSGAWHQDEQSTTTDASMTIPPFAWDFPLAFSLILRQTEHFGKKNFTAYSVDLMSVLSDK